MSDALDLGVVDQVTRRTMLKALGGAAAGAAMVPAATAKVAKGRPPGSDVRELSTPLYFSSANALVRAIRTNRLSAEEVARAFLARIRAVNPNIHAVVEVQWDGAIEQARKADERLM